MRRAPITSFRYCSITLGHTTILAMPVSSSSVMKTTPLALPGPLPHQHHAGATDAAPVVLVVDVLAGDDALLREPLAQKFHRVALQRQPHGLVIGDHLLRQRHLRQRLCVLVGLLAGDRGLKQRQRHVVGQPPHRPQRRAAVEPDGAERIGVGQQDQRALWQAGVAGEFLQRGEGTARAGGDDAVGPVVSPLPLPGRATARSRVGCIDSIESRGISARQLRRVRRYPRRPGMTTMAPE